MSVNRLNRRINILRGKREGCFDRNQYYMEAANRARVARKVRCRLRQMRPVTLHTPRWSAPERFLDDLAGDLAVGLPKLSARSLSVAALRGRDRAYALAWLTAAMREFFGIEEPVRQAIGSTGFRNLLVSYFATSDGGPHRALMLHGMETLGNELTQDLVHAYQRYLDGRLEHERRFVMLFGSSAGAETLRVICPGDEVEAEVVVLPDYGGPEIVDALVEHAGVQSDDDVLEAAAELSGGIPLVVELLGSCGGQMERLDSAALMRTLGPVGAEIRRAAAIVSADTNLADRFERLAREGVLPEDPSTDEVLSRAGLLLSEKGEARLRAPFLAELAVVE